MTLCAGVSCPPMVARLKSDGLMMLWLQDKERTSQRRMALQNYSSQHMGGTGSRG